jgi:hypothetical protein
MTRTPLSLADRTLGWHLGLGDLAQQDAPKCHGYANACRCPECRERERLTMEQPLEVRDVRQPWELQDAEAA